VVDLDGPGRMNLSPVLSGSSLVEDPMQDVGVDDMWSCDDDVVARIRRRGRDEASGVSAVAPEDSFRVLGNDLHDEVRTGLVHANLEVVGRQQQPRVLRIKTEADVNVSVRFSLQAGNRAGHRHAAIDELKPLREVDAGQRRSPLAFRGVEPEFDKWDLNPEVARYCQQGDTR